MKKGPVVIGAALALAAAVVVAPNAAWAQRSGHAFVGGGGRMVANGGGRAFVAGGGRATMAPQGFGHGPGFVHNPGFGHSHFPFRPFFRPFFPFGVGVVAVGPSFVYGDPYYYYPPPAYYPPAYYDQPVYSAPASYSPQPSATVSLAPAPPQSPPTPNVVQFATGRYELRGDGVSTPYTWVWIPNPPTAPPSMAPPGAEPSSAPAAPRAGHLYRWTDAQGVVYWTDRLDAIPEQYRSRARLTTPS